MKIAIEKKIMYNIMLNKFNFNTLLILKNYTNSIKIIV